MIFQKLLHQYLDFVKKYIPEPKVHSSVGIDIGLTSCKMVQVKPKVGSYELIHWAIEPITEAGPKEAVKLLMDQVKDVEYPPATAVHGKGSLIRYIDLPRMSVDDLKKSFVYEADKHLPFTADQIYMDFMILDPKEKGSKMSVMIAAAKREIINERVGFLKEIGIQADFVTLNPIAMANVINMMGLSGKEDAGGLKKKEAIALVDIGEKVTNLNIIYDGLPRFTRDIFIAGDDFTKLLANTFGLSMEEAEKLKCAPGIKKEEVLKACEPLVLNLVSDMRLSFDYFVTEHNIPLGRILLGGGASRLEGITDLFKNYFEMDIERWDPFYQVEIPESQREELQKVSGQLGVALGLALYG